MSFDKKKYINSNYDTFLLKLKITEKELLTLLNYTDINPNFTAKELKILARFAIYCHDKGPLLSKKRVKSFVHDLKSQRKFVERDVKYWTGLSKSKK